jgi:hypothetical protein
MVPAAVAGIGPLHFDPVTADGAHPAEPFGVAGLRDRLAVNKTGLKPY